MQYYIYILYCIQNKYMADLSGTFILFALIIFALIAVKCTALPHSSVMGASRGIPPGFLQHITIKNNATFPVAYENIVNVLITKAGVIQPGESVNVGPNMNCRQYSGGAAGCKQSLAFSYCGRNTTFDVVPYHNSYTLSGSNCDLHVTVGPMG